MNRRQDRQVFRGARLRRRKETGEKKWRQSKFPAAGFAETSLGLRLPLVELWRSNATGATPNGEIREHIESNPHVRSPKDIAKRFVGRNSAAVRAERIAKPFGGSGKDILREQAEVLA